MPCPRHPTYPALPHAPPSSSTHATPTPMCVTQGFLTALGPVLSAEKASHTALHPSIVPESRAAVLEGRPRTWVTSSVRHGDVNGGPRSEPHPATYSYLMARRRGAAMTWAPFTSLCFTVRATMSLGLPCSAAARGKLPDCQLSPELLPHLCCATALRRCAHKAQGASARSAARQGDKGLLEPDMLGNRPLPLPALAWASNVASQSLAQAGAPSPASLTVQSLDDGVPFPPEVRTSMSLYL